MPTKGVKVRMGGKERTLKLDNDALFRLEEEADQLPDTVYMRAQNGSIIAWNQLIWACLLHSEPELTLEEVRGMVDTTRLVEIGEAVNKAWMRAFGQDEQEAADEGNGEGASG